MKKNYTISFKLSKEEKELLDEALKLLNQKITIEIDQSEMIRISIKKICNNVKSDNIDLNKLLGYDTK
jgi:hypothetical protein